MRYRRQDEDGDYTFGQGQANFLVDSPECVAQSVETRLKLFTGEWWLDDQEGTPWFTQVVSAAVKNTVPLYDRAIRERVLTTPGVTGILDYSSVLDRSSRHLVVEMRITTEFGDAAVAVEI